MPTNPAASWWRRLSAAVTAFREALMSASRDRRGQADPLSDWGSYDARRLRYDVLWALYESTAYAPFHNFASRLKSDRQLYQAVRPLSGIPHRVSEFWTTHLYVGSPDPDAGPGKPVQSAVPIEQADDALRTALARLWRDSRLAEMLSLYCRFGSTLGDVGLKVMDDPDEGRVSLEVVDPRDVAWYAEDRYGRCTSYEIVRWVPDPRRIDTLRSVCYRETAELVPGVDGKPGRVAYATYLDDALYSWGGDHGPEWEEPYGFIPFQMTTHMKVRADSPFGFAEILSGVPLIHENDHVKSMFSDFVGKSVDAPFLFAGIPKPKETPRTLGSDATADNPYPRRTEIPALYADASATAQALVANLNLDGVCKFLTMLAEDAKEDFPEIRRDIEGAIGDASGKALRYARARVEAKAQKRRAGYDACLVRMMEASVAIGGMRGYPGYEGYGLGLYLDNVPSFRIGHRPVFQDDPFDRLDMEKEFLANCESADRAGIPVTAYWTLAGRDPADLALIERERQKALDAGLGVGRSKPPAPANEPAATAIQAPGGA